MIRLRTLPITLLVLSSAAHADEPARLVREDFAYGVAFETEGTAAVYRTALPEDVYRHTTRRDLGDVRVFNARGDVVPHAIRQTPSQVRTERRERDLPWFALRGEPSPRSGPFEVEVDPARGGALVRVLPASAEQADEAPSAYLLDASAASEGVSQLEFTFAADAGEVWVRLLVQGSFDLAHFEDVGGGVVASLERDASRLDMRTVSIASRPDMRYFRVTAQQGNLPKLARVRASLDLSTFEHPLVTLRVPPRALDADSTLFDAQGDFPVERAGLVFPERNTVVRGVLLSSATERGSFLERASALFFRLDGAMPVAAAPVDFPRTLRDRFYRLDLALRGAGELRPTLELHYRPDELVWVARGQGPFLLAYGSARAQPGEFTSSELTGLSPEPPAPATVGARRVLGGELRLVPEVAPRVVPWKTYVLWATLLASALALVIMGVRLARRTA